MNIIASIVLCDLTTATVHLYTRLELEKWTSPGMGNLCYMYAFHICCCVMICFDNIDCIAYHYCSFVLSLLYMIAWYLTYSSLTGLVWWSTGEQLHMETLFFVRQCRMQIDSRGAIIPPPSCGVVMYRIFVCSLMFSRVFKKEMFTFLNCCDQFDSMRGVLIFYAYDAIYSY